MRCKACASKDLTPLVFPTVIRTEEIGQWWNCRACGSDSSSHTYADVRHVYDEAYIHTHGEASDSPEKLEDQVRSNCTWFGHHADPALPRDFLDIGCCDGAALRVMAGEGWSVHGFDVTPPPYMGPHVTIRPYFHRWWFPIRYGAILAREVIEHLDSPSLFLHECHGATLPKGLFQVQTPLPSASYHGAVYQKAHLLILSHRALLNLLADAMFDVIEARQWDEDGRQPGQAVLCRAR